MSVHCVLPLTLYRQSGAFFALLIIAFMIAAVGVSKKAWQDHEVLTAESLRTAHHKGVRTVVCLRPGPRVETSHHGPSTPRLRDLHPLVQHVSGSRFHRRKFHPHVGELVVGQKAGVIEHCSQFWAYVIH